MQCKTRIYFPCSSIYIAANLFFVYQTSYENMCWRDLVTQFQCSSGVISAAIQLGSLKTKQVAL